MPYKDPKNPKEISRKKAYYQRTKEGRYERIKHNIFKWRKENPEAYKESIKKTRENRKEKLKEYNKKYRIENKEKLADAANRRIEKECALLIVDNKNKGAQEEFIVEKHITGKYGSQFI